MIQYPMTFEASADCESGMQTPWTTQARGFDHVLPMAIPPEFEGPGNGLSPEDLYAMALQNCFVATFKVFAEKSKIQFERLAVRSRLIVDRDEKGRPWMARLHLKVDVTGAVQVEQTKRVLEKTSQNCMILNSVRTEKTFEFNFLS